MVLSLVACGQTQPTATNEPTPTASSDISKEPTPTTAESTPSPTAAEAPTPTVEATPTATIAPTSTSEPTPTATVAPTSTPEATSTSAPAPTTKATSTPVPTKAPTSTPAKGPTGTPTPLPDLSPDNFIGYLDGDSYVNNYLGIRFTLPTGWSFVSGEQLAALISIYESLYGIKFADSGIDFSKETIIMQAISGHGQNSINMTVEDIGPERAAEIAALGNFEMAQYLEADFKKDMAKLGCSVSHLRNCASQFLIKNSFCVGYTLEKEGTLDTYCYLYLILKDNYIFSITMGSSSTGYADNQLLESFSLTTDKVPERKSYDFYEERPALTFWGSWGQTYINTFFDISFETPQGWSIIPHDTSFESQGLRNYLNRNATIDELFGNSQTWFLFEAINDSQTCDLKLGIERTGAAISFVSNPKNTIKEVASTLQEQYKTLGYSCSTPVIKERTIMREKRYILSYAIYNNQAYFDIVQCFIAKAPYLLTITFRTTDSTAETVLDYFTQQAYWLEPDQSVANSLADVTGKRSDTEYTNNLLGCRFSAKDTDWKISSGYSIAKDYGMSKDIYEDKKVPEYIASGNELTVFEALNDVKNQSITIYAIPYNEDARSNFTPANYETFISTSCSNNEEYLSSQGYTVTSKLEKFNFAGKEITGGTVFATSGDQSIEYSEFYILKDNIVYLLVFISYSGTQGDNMQVCNMFKAK